ncbi:unnamed protein product, partial [Mesorhabditis belari]|uniref:Uncharacterized protein n=1 Tax=Mesorhabditis belari TaxID=2138241 RepID=A0AAF3F3G9_9BILA
MHIISRSHIYTRGALLGVTLFIILFGFYGIPERGSYQEGEKMREERETVQQLKLPDQLGASNGINRTVNSRLKILEIEKKYCYKRNNCTLLQPLLDYSGRHLIAPDFGIAACAILKNFSTVLTSIMCYLFNIQSYETSVKDMMNDTWNYRHCGRQNEFFGMTGARTVEMKKMQSQLSLWRYYVITRDPMERFISGFLDKCIQERLNNPAQFAGRTPCYGCGDNLKCFLETQYKKYEPAIRGMKPGYGMESEHFAPQNWYCQLRTHYAEYQFYHYSRPTTAQLLDQLTTEFELLGVPKTVTKRLKEQIIGRRTYHTTYDSSLREKYLNQLKNDPLLMEIFMKIYFYDYTKDRNKVQFFFEVQREEDQRALQMTTCGTARLKPLPSGNSYPSGDLSLLFFRSSPTLRRDFTFHVNACKKARHQPPPEVVPESEEEEAAIITVKEPPPQEEVVFEEPPPTQQEEEMVAVVAEIAEVAV